MAYSEGSRRYIAFVKETTENTVPTTPTFTKIRNTGGSGIANERTSIQSNEIRSDRGISDMRLGQNAPNATVPAEFSYGAFDQLLEGVFADKWAGGVKLALTVDFTATGSYMTTDDASSWTEKGINVGDFVTISNAADVGNNGTFYVYAIGSTNNSRITLYEADKTTPATISDEADDAVTIHSGYVGGEINAATNGITVAATGKTMTAASAVWITTLDIKVGDWLNFSGFAQSGNNGWHRVTAVTDTVLTFAGSTLTNETLSSGTLTIGSYSGVIKTNTGDETPTFSVEEGFVDVGEYHYMKGAKIDTMSLSIQPDAMVTTEFALQGRSYVGFSSSSVATSVVDAAQNSPFDSYTGYLKFGSSITEASAIISGMEVSIGNNLNRRYPLMVRDAASIGEGRVNVSGSVNAFFTDSTIADYYANETEVSIEIQMSDLAGNAYVLTLPRNKFTSDSRDITENDVTQALEFQSLIDSTTDTTAVIRRQPATV